MQETKVPRDLSHHDDDDDDDNSNRDRLQESAPHFAKQDSGKKGGSGTSFFPGKAISVHYSHHGYGNDLEAKVAKKVKEEEDWSKYHSSVMKPDDANKKNKRDLFCVWICLCFFIIIGMIVYGFMSGLFLPNDKNEENIDPSNPTKPDVTSAERQAYMEELMDFYQIPFLEPSSPQEQAMQWLGFQDVPLDVPIETDEHAAAVYQRVRLQQRYALVVWYFAQGGPKLWTAINRDTSAGWITNGAGIHECDWHGIDCEVMPGMELLSDDEQDSRVVIGIRLNSAMGVVLTGTSLSSELGMLTNVRLLEFSSQRLEGSIPDEWKAMSNLGTVIVIELREYSCSCRSCSTSLHRTVSFVQEQDPNDHSGLDRRVLAAASDVGH
jgi:hypothetical protein